MTNVEGTTEATLVALLFGLGQFLIFGWRSTGRGEALGATGSTILEAGRKGGDSTQDE